ncbi:MAG: type II toxin-antitoxin system VapC family toxin [Nitrososphaerota archaeon]
MRVYLDSSAIAKRYLHERGSDKVDELFEGAERRERQLFYSAWNIGEVLGVFDARYMRAELDKRQLITTIKLFAGETKKLSALRALKIIPMTRTVLHEARRLILLLHIYQADAVQISTAKWVNADLFVSADSLLLEKAAAVGLRTYNPED